MSEGKPGQIVILNGTSGSGKSSTAELFVQKSDDFWLLYGIDHFLAGSYPAKFGHHGPRCAEGIYAHPIDPEKPEYPPVYAWTGLKKAFDRAGFSEAARRSPTRPIMRASV